MKNNAKILICNENAEERNQLIERLKRGGYENCEHAQDGENALEMIKKSRYDIVITDLWLSGIDGIGIIRSGLKAAGRDKPSFILTSPINKQAILVEATEAGADLCIPKPFDFSVMLSHIDSLIKIKSRKEADGDTTSPDIEAQVTKIIHQIGVPAHI